MDCNCKQESRIDDLDKRITRLEASADAHKEGLDNRFAELNRRLDQAELNQKNIYELVNSISIKLSAFAEKLPSSSQRWIDRIVFAALFSMITGMAMKLILK